MAQSSIPSSGGNVLAVSEPPAFSPVRFWLKIGAVLAVALGCIWFLQWGTMRRPLQKAEQLPVYKTVRNDITVLDRSGASINTTDLNGKVTAMAYVYTKCSKGCAGVVAHQIKLRDTFAREPDFQLVSVAVGADQDTPDVLKAFSSAHGVTEKDPWWFLTGHEAKLRRFMTDELGLEPTRDVPPDERLNPLDLYEHDLRVVLLDRSRRVRGYYAVQSVDPATAQMAQERLDRDIRQLLEKGQ